MAERDGQERSGIVDIASGLCFETTSVLWHNGFALRDRGIERCMSYRERRRWHDEWEDISTGVVKGSNQIRLNVLRCSLQTVVPDFKRLCHAVDKSGSCRQQPFLSSRRRYRSHTGIYVAINHLDKVSGASYYLYKSHLVFGPGRDELYQFEGFEISKSWRWPTYHVAFHQHLLQEQHERQKSLCVLIIDVIWPNTDIH